MEEVSGESILVVTRRSRHRAARQPQGGELPAFVRRAAFHCPSRSFHGCGGQRTASPATGSPESLRAIYQADSGYDALARWRSVRMPPAATGAGRGDR